MSLHQTNIQPAIDYAAIKQRQQAAWASGNYAVVGTTLQIVGEQLCETIEIKPDAKVLDVAAGNGNATLAAARRFADVCHIDGPGVELRNALFSQHKPFEYEPFDWMYAA